MSVDGETSNDNSRLMLGQASNMTMHTGNVIDWFLLKKNRRYSMISPDEVIFFSKAVLTKLRKNS